MKKQSTPQPEATKAPIVSFNFEERIYQIDPQQKKVYRRFVEIETAKASEILSVWRAREATV